MNFSSTTRRDFLTRVGAGLLAPAVSAPSVRVARADSAFPAPPSWESVQGAFGLDRSVVYLNAAGICATPTSVHEAYKHDLDFSNRLPTRHLWNVLEPRVEGVRRALAEELRCDAEELAFTRNATEALEIAQLGIPLRPGDEVLTTDQDFPRMLATWRQRERRDGIRLRTVSFPTPVGSAETLVDLLVDAIGPRTRVLLFCQVTNLSGQIFPSERICREARARGVLTIVDGAQGYGHVPTRLDSLGCDYYGTSLHKYLMAPLGTGLLYVRRERIEELWPLMPSRRPTTDIRKLEDVGTHPAAGHNAIAEALRFRAAVGADRIAERLRWLTRRWSERASHLPGARLRGARGSWATAGINTLELEGYPPGDLATDLWEQFGIVTRPIDHRDCRGIRVSPHVYNTPAEIDRLVLALETLNHQRRREP